nr:MAG TPA: hypothetical protein [Bacteriophage sp.]
MNNAPQYGDFQAVTGGYCNDDAFTVWRKTMSGLKANFANNGYHVFRYPLKLFYNGSSGTAGQRNRIWFVVKNDTGAAAQVEYALRIWYTDL